MHLITTNLTGVVKTESILGALLREDGLFRCLSMLAIECSRNRDAVRRYIAIFIRIAYVSLTRLVVVASDRLTEDICGLAIDQQLEICVHDELGYRLGRGVVQPQR